ncbi:MAG TPA: hypothetical protein VGB96_00330 [Archangium sp.]
MPPEPKPEPLRWYVTAPVIWALGLPHFFPLLGLYVFLGGRQALPLMLGALAATGCFAGIIEALAVSAWALLITPVSFFLGFAPGPYLIFGGEPGSPRPSFNTAMLMTLVTSTICVTAGQWLLSLATHGEEAAEEEEGSEPDGT